MNESTIEFTGVESQGPDMFVEATLAGLKIHLTGHNEQALCCDAFSFELDAVGLLTRRPQL